MQGLVPGILTALFVPLERSTLRREYFNGLWRLAEYLLARSLVSAAIHLACCTIFCSLFYFMIDLRGSFLRFLFPLVFLGIVTQQLGLVLGSLFGKATLSVPAFLPINIAAVMFSGFFFTKTYLTKRAQYVLFPLWYASFYRYTFGLIAVNEFESGRFRACRIADGDICPYDSYAEDQVPHVKRDVVMRQALDVDVAQAKNYYPLVLLAFIVGFYILMFILIKYKALRN